MTGAGYQPGDIANGYRLGEDGQWRPLAASPSDSQGSATGDVPRQQPTPIDLAPPVGQPITMPAPTIPAAHGYTDDYPTMSTLPYSPDPHSPDGQGSYQLGQPPQDQYRVGEQVNGYRWSGSVWEPIAASGDGGYSTDTVANGHQWNGYEWVPLAPNQNNTQGSGNESWYKQWWGITLMVVGALFFFTAVAAVAGSGEPSSVAQPATTPSKAASSPATISEPATAAPTPEPVATTAAPAAPAPAAPATTAPAAPAADPAAVGVGTPTRDGKFEFTVLRTKAGVPTVGPEMAVETAQGAYTLVELQVTNIGAESQLFDSSTISGVDNLGRQMSSDGSATLWANNGAAAFLNQINPGNTVKAVIVFDVPAGATLNELLVKDSPWSVGAKITLV